MAQMSLIIAVLSYRNCIYDGAYLHPKGICTKRHN